MLSDIIGCYLISYITRCYQILSEYECYLSPGSSPSPIADLSKESEGSMNSSFLWVKKRGE